MSLLGIRFCRVAEGDEAEALADALGAKGLGVPARDMAPADDEGFSGAVFPLAHEGGQSWVEIWQAADGMPPGTMLQLVVDDADAYAERARGNGLQVEGPFDAHGERIYAVSGLPGLQLSFQSKLAD